MRLPPTLRSLAKQPGFCAIVILTLALGIGINAAIFSVVDTMLIRGMPVPKGERVLALGYRPLHGSDDERLGASYPEFRELRAAQKSFVDFGAYKTYTAGFTAPGKDPERIEAGAFTAAALQMIEAPILLGRWFTAAEEMPGQAPVVVLSEGLWRRLCQADPQIVGQQVRLDGEWATVVGVAAKGYRFPELTDAWTPPRAAHELERWDVRGYTLFGRVRDGVALATAQAELEALAARQIKDHPETSRDIVPRVKTLSQVNLGSTDRMITSVMLAAVFLVLLIACANTANLLLVRALGRERELVVRSALGADRRTLVGLIFREAAVLAAAGAVCGLLLGFGGIRLLSDLVQQLPMPHWMTVFTLDARALVYTLTLAVFSCFVAGLVPAWRLTRPDLNTVLSDASRGSSGQRLGRFTGLLVIGQIALSALLLVFAALTVRTVVKIQTLPLGLDPSGVYTGRVSLPKTAYPELAQQRAFHTQLLQRLRERPEVAQVGSCDLLATWDADQPVVIEDRPLGPGQRAPSMALLTVSPGYLEALRIGLLSGRDFNDADTAESQRVGLVSSVFAERHWPGQNALGKRFRLPDEQPEAWITVVGVVRNRMQGRFTLRAAPQVYVPFTQSREIERMSYFVKARSGDASALATVLRSTVRTLNDELPVYFAEPLEVALTKAHYNKRLLAGIFTAFGLAAAVLAAIGLFGVTSYGVAQRTQEFGIRMALGASPRHVLLLVLGEGGWRLLLGLTLGLGGAFSAAGLLTVLLYGVTASDPASYLAPAALLGLTALAATLLPGLRAMRVLPAVALRGE